MKPMQASPRLAAKSEPAKLRRILDQTKTGEAPLLVAQEDDSDCGDYSVLGTDYDSSLL